MGVKFVGAIKYFSLIVKISIYCLFPEPDHGHEVPAGEDREQQRPGRQAQVTAQSDGGEVGGCSR